MAAHLERCGHRLFHVMTARSWTQHTVDLTRLSPGLATPMCAWHFMGMYRLDGNDIHIDDVLAGPCPAAPLPAVLWQARCMTQNTGLPLAGVTVKSGTSSAVCRQRGMYVLFSTAGTHDVTAIAPKGYDNVTASVSVADGDVTGQDFQPPGRRACSHTREPDI